MAKGEAEAGKVVKPIGGSQAAFRADPFNHSVEGLKTKKYHLLINNLMPTARRLRPGDFSDSFGIEVLRFLS